MGNQSRLLRLLGATLIAGSVVGMTAGTAIAQEGPDSQATDSQATDSQNVAQARERYYRPDPDVRPLPTIPEAFQRAYYSHTGNFFDNRGIWQSFRLIFGVPNYVENSISQDGRAVNRLYREVLKQQTSSDPVLRTPDLPNPYTGSVLTTPLVITEEPIAPAPPFPSIRRPDYVEPAPVAPATPQREEPVPALW